MPIIKKRYVKKAKKRYVCDECGFVIFIGDPYVYLFGMYHCGEEPYALHICDECGCNFKQPISN